MTGRRTFALQYVFDVWSYTSPRRLAQQPEPWDGLMEKPPLPDNENHRLRTCIQAAN